MHPAPPATASTKPLERPGLALARSALGLRRLVTGWLLWVAASLSVGCGGEVDVSRFIVRPSLEDYRAEIQPMLVAMQCSVPACHGTTFVGEVRVTAEPDDEALYRDYQSLKALANPQSPEASVLLARLLEGQAGATHVPLCFKSTDDCTYRKLVAWIAWDGEGPTPAEIDCDYAGETCFR